MVRLTAKEEAFAQNVADGCTGSEAYRRSYGTKASNKRVSQLASRVFGRERVRARVLQLKSRTETVRALSRERKRELLARMIETEETAKKQKIPPAELRAMIETDNRMAGHNEPEKLKVEGIGSVLQKIRRDAPKP